MRGTPLWGLRPCSSPIFLRLAEEGGFQRLIHHFPQAPLQPGYYNLGCQLAVTDQQGRRSAQRQHILRLCFPLWMKQVSPSRWLAGSCPPVAVLSIASLSTSSRWGPSSALKTAQTLFAEPVALCRAACGALKAPVDSYPESNSFKGSFLGRGGGSRRTRSRSCHRAETPSQPHTEAGVGSRCNPSRPDRNRRLPFGPLAHRSSSHHTSNHKSLSPYPFARRRAVLPERYDKGGMQTGCRGGVATAGLSSATMPLCSPAPPRPRRPHARPRLRSAVSWPQQ